MIIYKMKVTNRLLKSRRDFTAEVGLQEGQDVRDTIRRLVREYSKSFHVTPKNIRVRILSACTV
jgi:hypothetical protein